MKRPISRLAPGALGLAVLAMPAAAGAATMCVTCVGPDATYRCVSEAASSPTDARYQYLCITEIAKSGGHQSCSVSRNASGPCDGPERVVGLAPAFDTNHAPQPITATPGDIPPPAAGAPALGGAQPAPVTATGAPGTGAPLPPAQSEPRQPMPEPIKSGETEIPKSPPPTVGEMAKNASESTPIGKANKALQDTGKAVGNAAKKTWNCFASLFNDC
jgi:hypothetical protein